MIVEYDAGSPRRFETIPARVRTALGPSTTIEHIGSTLVPDWPPSWAVDDHSILAVPGRGPRPAPWVRADHGTPSPALRGNDIANPPRPRQDYQPPLESAITLVNHLVQFHSPPAGARCR